MIRGHSLGAGPKILLVPPAQTVRTCAHELSSLSCRLCLCSRIPLCLLLGNDHRGVPRRERGGGSPQGGRWPRVRNHHVWSRPVLQGSERRRATSGRRQQSVVCVRAGTCKLHQCECPHVCVCCGKRRRRLSVHGRRERTLHQVSVPLTANPSLACSRAKPGGMM